MGDAFKGRGPGTSSAPALSKGRNEKNIEETLEVNEMLVDAIKAKLAILDNINDN